VRYKTSDNTGANVNSNEFEVFLDAQNLSEGNYLVAVNYISKNPKITVVSIEPSQLELNLEAITSKEIKLTNEVSGSPAKGYDLKNVKLSQETIKISGAASVLANITELPIKIALDGSENADFSRKITMEAPGDWNLSGKTVNFDPPIIQVDIEVRKSAGSTNSVVTTPSGSPIVDNPNLKNKTLMVQIVKNPALYSSVKELLPENILVTVEGAESEIAKLNNDSIKLNLDPSKISKGSYTVNSADIKIPLGVDVKIVQFSPMKVLVKY
jgi:hypothetical protein